MQPSAFATRRGSGGAVAGLAFVFSLVLLATSVSGFAGVGSHPDVGTMSTTYGGRAYGVSTHTPGVGDATYADTGDLPASGGVLFANFTQVGDPLATASVDLSYTRGFSDVGWTEVATSDVTLIPGSPYQVVSSFAYAGATATAGGANGRSEIPDLTVGGVAVPVTGLPNQIYEIPGVLTLVINEQIDRSSGATRDITVNALHLVLATGVEAVVSSARAVVTSSPFSLFAASEVDGIAPMTSPPMDFMTGGGFFFANAQSTCPGDRVNFGFNAGPRPGGWPEIKGRLNLVDHGLFCPVRHVQGTNVDTYEANQDDPQNCRDWKGNAQVNGMSGFRYRALTCDYGEPGRDDRFRIEVRMTSDMGPVVYVADNSDGSPSPNGGNLPGGNIQLHVYG